MLDVINLALPFFGLIFIGFACAKLTRIEESALGWMNFFIVYVALPALFYRILAKTPFEQLAQPAFILGTTLSTFLAFAAAFIIAMSINRGRVGDATMAGLVGGYGNIGYMGPGLALATLGAQASVPVALIFCFDHILLFTLVPFLMSFDNPGQRSVSATALDILRRIFTNPLLIASALGALSAAFHIQPPVAIERLMEFLHNAAAPCALFTLGVTVALRPLQKAPYEVPFNIAIKLVVHPLLVLALLWALGPFDPLWIATAMLMAALPPALNVYVFARQYNVWLEQASSAILLGTLVSVLTLTTVMWLVSAQAIPLLRP